MKSTLCALAMCLLLAGISKAQSDTEREIKQLLIEGAEEVNQTMVATGDTYSKHGALEFWSSGGLLNEIPPGGRSTSFDMVRITPKHIRVITLVEGQAAVAHFYSEGSMKPQGSDAVSTYLSRVSQVFVKEDGEWKLRSSHWSPVTGGGGTTQVSLIQ